MYDFNFAPVLAAFDQLAIGAWLTVRLSCAAMLIGLVVSIFCSWGKTSGPKILRAVIDGYIEIIRNTPFLVQIFFIYFGMPSLGLRLSPNSAALLALVVNFGAYGTEIIRAGIESIHKGQVEAGWALGLSRAQIFRYIIMKPALRTVYPALTSQFIYLMLNTSVVSVISADDLTAAGNDLQSATFASFEVYITVTLIYLALSVGFSALFYAIEKMTFKYPLSR
ncbi:amino acid ABC transporter permease [Sinorhizobium mexicanum]|uniref:Amino acid ABC transporter permease n=1 Tax=Sinorhizobium mexicanum TaxID=375549 RepID=A0A859QIX8_9HYPH|nr:amino acid ABC transporter permease [Sinorhizobium mexicanum]MBP1884021.1 polar amino acid transport system permease protein [Sinorhizobium mexicanum]QLL64744.1 amino acid ABC transporter permease [Sinorhizobium mexicanum]